MADLSIDGWTCRLVRGQRSAQNYALEMGAWLMPDGRLNTEGAETDGSMVMVTIPPAVLAWLVAPMIDSGWAQGHTSGMRMAKESPEGGRDG
jgi:hypothetical protein